MTIKILHAADIHIDLHKQKVPLAWQLNRFKQFFQKMLELEKSHDLVVLAGDIFDAHPKIDETTLFNSYLNKVTVPTIVIPGNHEASKKGETFLQAYIRDEAISNPNVMFFTKNARINFKGYWIQMFPYPEVQKDNLENYLEKDILITHIRGEIPPHITAEYDFEKLRDYKLVLLGDLHFYHKYKNYNVFYPGSPLNINFDRNEDKKYGVISHTYWKEGHTHTFIDLELPKLIRRKIKAGEEMIDDPVHRVIYEVEGSLSDIQKVAKTDLLDKKIIDIPRSQSALDLKNKNLIEELATYLSYLNINKSELLEEFTNLNVSSIEENNKSSASIILKTLSWSNMYSFGEDNYLDFTKNKVTQLDAINGTGKTAIMLIVQELLTSKNMKGIKKGDILNRYKSSKGWNANLDFDLDKVPFQLSVNRVNETAKVKLLENGKDISEHKIPDTYKLLLSKFNTSPDVLNQLIYQSSTSQLEFLKATDSNRKKFLVNLFSLERYLQIGETIKVKITQVEKSMAGLQGELKAVQDFLTNTVNLGEKQKKKPVPAIDDSIRDEIKQLETEILNHETLCLSIDKNNLLLKEFNSIKFDNNLLPPDSVQYEENVNTFNEFTGYSRNFNKERIELIKRKGSLNTATHCHVCKQPIDNSHTLMISKEIDQRIAEIDTKDENLNESIKILRDNIQKYTAAQRLYDENQKNIQRFEQLSALINKNLTTTYPILGDIKTKLLNKKSDLQIQTQLYEDAIKYNNEVDILNAKLDVMVNQKREFLSRQELLNNSIINVQSQLDRLTILKKAFSPTGIVAFKLENIIKEFETEINNYLIEFSDGQFQINFRLEGEKLNIIVFNNGVESPIENVSEGEFSRIQTSTLLAIRKLLTKIGGIKINLLFLDEVMGVLDKVGQDKLVEILQEEEDTNTFLVAHGYDNPLVTKLHIVKTNNISRIL